MRSILLLAVAATFSTGAIAQAAQSDQDHNAHHPAEASAPAAATRAPATPAPRGAQEPTPSVSAVSPEQLDSMMKSLQDMHGRMTAARTPEERQALMAEHMNAMKGGMAMLGQLKGGPGGTSMSRMPDRQSTTPEMLGRRMDMMEMMMQMMMDREASRSMPAN